MNAARALPVSLFFLNILIAGCVIGPNPVEALAETRAWSSDAQENRNLMVGKWLGESKADNGDLKLTLIERNKNGTYRITFRSYTSDSAYEEAVEVGLWGVSGTVYFTIMRGWIIDGNFKPSDPTRAYFYDAYQVISLSPMSFEYESIEKGIRFSNQRVGEDFQFSD